LPVTTIERLEAHEAHSISLWDLLPVTQSRDTRLCITTSVIKSEPLAFSRTKEDILTKSALILTWEAGLKSTAATLPRLEVEA
jgi:hypothetical protein